jgi:hypothetical protein
VRPGDVTESVISQAKQGSISFLKKRNKKLLIFRAAAAGANG